MKNTLLALFIFIILAPPLSAADQQYGGFYYSKSGSGIAITGYTGRDAVVDIPATIDGIPVVRIGDSVFMNCGMTNMTIPDSVTSIGGQAFYGCTSLMNVTIGNNVTNIGRAAFFLCASLQKVTIPDSVTSIGGQAFYDCSSLASFAFGSNVTAIGNSAFYRCVRLTSMAIPDSVTFIGTNAFSGCTSLTSLAIGNQVNTATITNSAISIGERAFSDCTGLTNVTLGGNVNFLGYSFLNLCPSLSSITVDEANAVYSSREGVLLSKDKTALLLYPKRKAGSYSIPDTVTYIGPQAFYACANMTAVIIPNSVTVIQDSAFQHCTGLSSVIIPASVIYIGYYAFNNCASLTAIAVDPLNTVCTSMDGVLFNKNKTALIQFACGKVGSYAVPASVTTIWGSAFSGCAGITNVVIESVIAGGWCSDLINLESATIGNNVTAIADSTFANCTNLKHAILGDSVTSIGASAFQSCKNLAGIVIPNKVIAIGDNAFYGCSKLTGIYLPDSVASIGYNAFNGCQNLAEIRIGKNVTSIGYRAFNSCTSLRSVMIPSGVALINPETFSGCTSLIDVEIGKGVTFMDYLVFSGCASLTSVFFEGNAPAYSSWYGVFYNAGKGLTVYYRSNTTGWGPTFSGRPTSLGFKGVGIVNPLDSGVIMEGATLSLSSQIGGVPMPGYQWFFNSLPLAGATNDVLVISPASSSHAGDYSVIASNKLGVVTNGPATWGVNNVVTSNYLALMITDQPGTRFQLQSAESASGPWTYLADLTPTSHPQAFIDFIASGTGQRYYRTAQPGRLEPRICRGWNFTAPAGSIEKIEYVDGETGFNNWQFLTNLTLPSSPYLYIDTTATHKRPRHYRTTAVP